MTTEVSKNNHQMTTTAKVLTIDDDPLIRESIAAFLEDIGYLVVEASNGEEGLAALRQHPDVAVILCDLHMPIMNGVEMLTRLRASENDVPFIIVAGADMVGKAIEAIRIGASDYVLKPITDMDILERSLNQTLERVRLMRENKQYRDEILKANKELSVRLAEIKEDQEAARVVQFSLLPEKNMTINGVRFNHHIFPSLFLSGDFIDYFKISDTLLGFYIADVSGHGAPSAFVTVLLKSLVNQFAQKYKGNQDDIILQPTKLLKSISIDIHKAKLGKYLTMIYAIIDTERDLMHYCIGGHFPNPIFTETGRNSEYLPGSGFPVGVFDKAEYQLKTIELPKSFTLVFFSDGVLEIVPCEELKDKEAFLLNLVNKQKLTSEDIIQGLGLKEKETLPDDVTYMIVTRGD